MEIGQERAVFAAVPTEKIKRASQWLLCRSIYAGTVRFRLEVDRALRARCQSPGRGPSGIEAQRAPHILVDLDLMKVRRVLWPLHVPAHCLCEILFVRPIPLCRSKLY